jgi:hypothetical protein
MAESFAATLDVTVRASGETAWKRWLKPAYHQMLIRHPSLFFALAGIRSHFPVCRSPHTPSLEEVASLWKDLPLWRQRQVARRIGAIEFLNRELFGLVQHCGIAEVAPLVRCQGAERLLDLHARKQPAILIGWHFRTFCYLVLSALHRLEIPALVIGFLPKETPPGFVLLPPSHGDSTQRAALLKRTLEHLHNGGLVYTCIDPAIGVGTTSVSFLGRQLQLRRGAAVLSRLSGAPLIPVSPMWNSLGSGVTVTVHDPLPSPDCPPQAGVAFDDAMMAIAARWFEGYMQRAPEELSIDRLTKSLEEVS